MNDKDLQKLLEVLNKMDKKALESGLQKASEALNSKDKDAIINALKKFEL